MQEFRYMTLKPGGTGYVWHSEMAISRETLETELRNARTLVIRMEEREKIVHKGQKRVRLRDLTNFAQQMETGFAIGMPILRMLSLTIDSTPAPFFKQVLTTIRNEVQQGTPISHAMAKWTKVFDPIFIAFVSAGEHAGIMSSVWAQLRAMLVRNQQIKSKVRSVMMYPMILSIVTALVVAFLMFNTIPKFVTMFSATKVPLPFLTQIVVAISEAVKDHPFAGVIGVGLFIFTVISSPKLIGKIPALHGVLLKIPVFGGLMRKVMLANFTRTFGQLINADVPVIQALYLCRDLSDNVVYRKGIAQAILSVTEGNRICEALISLEPLFGPEMICQFGFGEDTGNIASMLKPLAKRQDDELFNFIEDSKPALEAMMYVILGTIVGGLVMSIFLPIFDMGKVVKGM